MAEPHTFCGLNYLCLALVSLLRIDNELMTVFVVVGRRGGHPAVAIS